MSNDKQLGVNNVIHENLANNYTKTIPINVNVCLLKFEPEDIGFDNIFRCCISQKGYNARQLQYDSDTQNGISYNKKQQNFWANLPLNAKNQDDNWTCRASSYRVY